jgi:nitrogen fixation/metabolism regulation signal transduction histidine kinase
MRDPGDGGGTIALQVQADRQPPSAEVQITVTNEGIGLPETARLTEPDVAHKPKATGLGLAIAKKDRRRTKVKRLALADRAEGLGAMATLNLPTRIADAA